MLFTAATAGSSKLLYSQHGCMSEVTLRCSERLSHGRLVRPVSSKTDWELKASRAWACSLCEGGFPDDCALHKAHASPIHLPAGINEQPLDVCVLPQQRALQQKGGACYSRPCWQAMHYSMRPKQLLGHSKGPCM